MNEKTISHIVCAVRGRPQNRDTATQAIDMALEHNARLTFVPIIDAEFLGMATPGWKSSRSIAIFHIQKKAFEAAKVLFLFKNG